MGALPALNVSIVALPRDERDALEWGVSAFTRGPQGSGLGDCVATDPVMMMMLLSYWLGRREGLIWQAAATAAAAGEHAEVTGIAPTAAACGRPLYKE